MKQTVVAEVAKSAPPVSITAWAWLNGIPIDKWVGYATLAYLLLQAAYLVWRWYRETHPK
jgi:hypothetical protein